jgi:hypothetical protein
MKIFLTIGAFLLSVSLSFAQKLPGNFTCQDLIESADGKVSRTTDGGRTYVPIKVPRPGDAAGYSMLTYTTLQCRRLSSGEISLSEFDTLNAEKARQLQNDRQKTAIERRNIENQERALRNQEQAIQNQRNAAAIQAQQAEAARLQEAAQHRELIHQQQIQQRAQQQQLERIRQEQARPRSFSCFGGGNYIHCN